MARAYGGQLYKMNATLSSVEQGVTTSLGVSPARSGEDAGCRQFGTVTPFTHRRCAHHPRRRQRDERRRAGAKREWRRTTWCSSAPPASTPITVHKNPIATYADLKGRKISAPGSIGLWLKGSGAVPVDGSLTTYYIRHPVRRLRGYGLDRHRILPNKIYEVAPYITT